MSWQQLYDDAHLQLRQGYYDKAITEAADGYKQAKEKAPVWGWKFRILQAEAFMRNQQLRQSIELLAEDPPASFPIEISARKRIVQGQALCRFGKRADGESVLGEAEKLIPAASQTLQAELAFARGYCAFSSPVLAQQYFEKAAELARASDSFTAASALGNIGHLLSTQRREDEAIEWYQKVVPLAQATGSRLLEEKILGNLGNSYSELGDFRRAIENSEQAQRIASAIGRSEDEESWLVTLGRSYAALPGEYPDKAESSYLKALAIAKELHDQDISTRCLHNLTQLALDDHQVARARDYWKQEVAGISAGSPAEIDAFLDEGDIALAEGDLKKAKQLFQRIIDDPRTNLTRRSVAQGQMGNAYWQENNTAEADHAFQQSIHTVEDELSKTQEKYWVSILDEHSLLFDTYIRFLVGQNQQVRALAEAEHLRELTQGIRPKGGKALDITAVQRQLKGRNQVILDYYLTDDETLLWVITGGDCQLFHLPSHRELYQQQLIDRHNRFIQDQRPIEESTAGQELYKALIQPAAKFIPKGTHVSIVPSKIVWLLNFETLVVPGSHPHYWIEDVVVQNSSSLRRASKSTLISGLNRKELLLMGAPEEVNPAYPTLKYAADEIGRIKSLFQAAQKQVVSGAEATPQAYKTSNPQQYRFIHFVTHGIPNEKVPMESAIVLSGTNNSYKLYARDIIAIPLHADLVTISACYGAGKRWYVGEGMVGLGWAFMRAGAHQVIAALWEVDDASSPELMDDFYRELTRHPVTADALRDAKLKMLHSEGPRRLPYFWGSLQLYIGS